MSDTEKVIIIGSGPAGNTAAIYTARAGLRPLFIEGFSVAGVAGGQLMTTTEIENYPGFPQGISGPELMDAMRRQSERFGVRFVGEDVDSVDLSRRPFNVVAGGVAYSARALIVATGASAKYLGLASEKRLLNRGVSACATCDGALPIFRNRELVVVGGGDTAMEEANYLTRFASKVLLVHRREAFRASKLMVQRTANNAKIELVTNTVIEEILGDEQVSAVRLRHVKTGALSEKQVAGVFVAIGHQPNTALFAGKLDLDEIGYIITRGKSSYTSVEGVFAAGDVQDSVYRQAITAAGSGCQAAIDAERWLEGQGV